MPNCVDRNLAGFSGINDPRISNPGNSVVVIGLFDHLREADRRAEKFRSKLDLYFQRRFDCNESGESTEEQYRLQMKKYAAGLVFNLINSAHPHADRYKAALKNSGRNLEDFIREENKKEVMARQGAEKAAYFLARWINDPAGIFEQVLNDYTATKDNQDHWDMVTEFYCGLLNRFNELSITRKYISDKWDNKESWLNKYLLNENAFQGYRKVTVAVVEFLKALSTVAYRNVSIMVTSKTFEGIYATWFVGVKFEVFSMKYVKTERHNLQTIALMTDNDVIKRIRLSKECKPFKELGNLADHKVIKGVLVAFEAINLGVVTVAIYNADQKDSKIALGMNGIGSIADFAIVMGSATKNAGIMPLSALGTLSAAIDCGLALYDSVKEAQKDDYDAMVSKIIAGTGAATITVGSAMVTAAAFSMAVSICQGASLAVVLNTIWSFGVGSTATGVGCPIGGALVFVGAVIFAAGTISYFFSNDSKTEEWLKHCEWGQYSLWTFLNGSAYNLQIDNLHSILYSFSAETWYDPWGKYAGVKIVSPHFQPETKIFVQEIVLKGGGYSEKIVKEQLIIEDGNNTPGIRCKVKNSSEVEVVVTIAHKTMLEEHDSIEAKVFVDLFGNNKVILPARDTPVVCKGRIFF